MKAKSSPFLSRRTLVQGSAWAVPLVTASATIPAYASSVECEYGGYEQAFANTSADGTSRTYTVTVDKKTKAFKFSITGGSGGSYQGSAQGGTGVREPQSLVLSMSMKVTLSPSLWPVEAALMVLLLLHRDAVGQTVDPMLVHILALIVRYKGFRSIQAD